jgi:tRNA(adenine34) deaminase
MVETTPEWVFDDADRAAMQAALAEAAAAGRAGEVPVGAVVIGPAGETLAAAGNRRERDADPTAHAEIVALRAAARATGLWRLDGCTLFVTLEPCAMCAAACVAARLQCVVWGSADPKAGFCGSLANLLEDPRLNHRVAWRAGLYANEAAALLDAFFAKLRRQR